MLGQCCHLVVPGGSIPEKEFDFYGDHIIIWKLCTMVNILIVSIDITEQRFIVLFPVYHHV